MGMVTVGQENSNLINLYYEDHGMGTPIVLIHGYPLSGASWEKQVTALLAAGYRVITYDRRGFGLSSKPTVGYNYDTFADDLHKLVTKLELENFVLAGFSMGGGEVARYIGKYGSDNVSKAVFLSPVAPFLLKTSETPNGLPKAMFDGIQALVLKDRLAFLHTFFINFYNVDKLRNKRVSDQVVHYSWNVAASASPVATHDCVAAWYEDFRPDVAKIKIPTLIVQGDADRILPIAATGKELVKKIPGAKLVVIKGGPHCIPWTHGDEVNKELVGFLG